MQMPDGRRLNLATTSGAEAYVATFPRFASLNCTQLLAPRNPESMKMQVVVCLGTVAGFMTEETFAGVAIKEKRTVASTFRAMLRAELQDGSHFRRTGKLPPVPQEMLAAMPVWCKDSAFTDALLETDGKPAHTPEAAGDSSALGAAAALSAAHASPSAEFATHLMDVIRNAAISRGRRPNPKDRSLSDAEPSGILEQVVRFSVQTGGDYLDAATMAVFVLQQVRLDMRFVRKRWRPDKPCGQAVERALAGGGGLGLNSSSSSSGGGSGSSKKNKNKNKNKGSSNSQKSGSSSKSGGTGGGGGGGGGGGVAAPSLNPKAVVVLRQIQAVCEAAQAMDEHIDSNIAQGWLEKDARSKGFGHCCRRCDKNGHMPGVKLKACSRCHTAWYCSREW